MKNTFYLFLSCIISLFACKTEQVEPQNKGQHVVWGTYSMTVIPGKDSIQLQTFSRNGKIDDLVLPGKLDTTLIGDLNEDGQPEGFVVVDMGPRKDIYALSIFDDYTLELYKKNYEKAAGGLSSGFKIINQQLVEYFTPTQDSLDFRQLQYNLVKGEASMMLLPQGYSSKEIEALCGTYINDKKLWTSMSILPNDMGEFAVVFIGATQDNQTPSCDFTGVGQWINKDLFVPLNRQNKDLVGTLKITFVDETAFVYTANPENNKELTAYCKNNSLAGAYKKQKQPEGE